MLQLTQKTTNVVLTNEIGGITVRYHFSMNGDDFSSPITADANIPKGDGNAEVLTVTSTGENSFRISSVITDEVQDISLLNGIIADIKAIRSNPAGVLSN